MSAKGALIIATVIALAVAGVAVYIVMNDNSDVSQGGNADSPDDNDGPLPVNVPDTIIKITDPEYDFATDESSKYSDYSMLSPDFEVSPGFSFDIKYQDEFYQLQVATKILSVENSMLKVKGFTVMNYKYTLPYQYSKLEKFAPGTFPFNYVEKIPEGIDVQYIDGFYVITGSYSYSTTDFDEGITYTKEG